MQCWEFDAQACLAQASPEASDQMGPVRFTVTQHARNGAQFGLFPRCVIQSTKGVKLIVHVAKQECHSLLLFGHCAPLRGACTG